MDLRRSIFGLSVLILFLSSNVYANWVFRVQHKFAGRQQQLSAIKAHDGRRHRRFLYGVDLPLGGDGDPTSTGFVSY